MRTTCGRSRYPSEELPKLMLRLPAALKAWLGRQAAENRRSQNGEIVHLLERAMFAANESNEGAGRASV